MEFGSDAYQAHSERVRIVSGRATGCIGTIRTAFNDGGLWYGVELDEMEGLNDGRDKSGTYRFRCQPGFGLFLRQDAVRPLPHHDSRYGPDMLGRRGVEADDPAVALSSDLHHKQDGDMIAPIAPWGSSYTKAYTAGDWEAAHDTATEDNRSWVNRLDEAEATLLEKRTNYKDLTYELQSAKIDGDREEIERVSQGMVVAKKELHEAKKARDRVSHSRDDVEKLETDHRNQNINLQLAGDLRRVDAEMHTHERERRRPAFNAVSVKPKEGHGVYETDISLASKEGATIY